MSHIGGRSESITSGFELTLKRPLAQRALTILCGIIVLCIMGFGFATISGALRILSLLLMLVAMFITRILIGADKIGTFNSWDLFLFITFILLAVVSIQLASRVERKNSIDLLTCR